MCLLFYMFLGLVTDSKKHLVLKGLGGDDLSASLVGYVLG